LVRLLDAQFVIDGPWVIDGPSPIAFEALEFVSAIAGEAMPLSAMPSESSSVIAGVIAGVMLGASAVTAGSLIDGVVIDSPAIDAVVMEAGAIDSFAIAGCDIDPSAIVSPCIAGSVVATRSAGAAVGDEGVSAA
jgi:hypothetical protein